MRRLCSPQFLEHCRIWNGPIMVLEQIANLSLGVIRVLSSSLSRSARIYADVAQLVEQRIENPCVTGSTPVFGTNNTPKQPNWYEASLSKGESYRFESDLGYQKSLCSDGRAAQCNGLQIRKTVSSNLTRYSKLNVRHIVLEINLCINTSRRIIWH